MATCQRFDFNDKNAREMIAHIEAFSMEKFLGIMAGTVTRSDLFPNWSVIVRGPFWGKDTKKWFLKGALKGSSKSVLLNHSGQSGL